MTRCFKLAAVFVLLSSIAFGQSPAKTRTYYIAADEVGVALLRTCAVVAGIKGDNHDQDAGIKIVLRALEEPLRQIVANCGDEPSVVINKVKEGKGNFGYNAATSEYGDMVEMGVLDPTKVTRYALQHAASVASLMLTTDALVAELPKEESAG